MERINFTQTLFADMVALYKIGDISQLCLSLQQDADADVPIFLICLMADRANLGCEEVDFAGWVASGQSWREAVIKPLRQLRMHLKSQRGDDSVSDFRKKIKVIELEAEQHHVEALGRGFTQAQNGAQSGRPLAARYLQMLGLSKGQIAQCLQGFAAQLEDL